MSAPETEAGRALARDLHGSVYQLLTDERTGTPIILAIEAEARATVLTEAIRRVEGLTTDATSSAWGEDEFWVDGESYVRSAAVLAILQDLASRDTGATTGGEG